MPQKTLYNRPTSVGLLVFAVARQAVSGLLVFQWTADAPDGS